MSLELDARQVIDRTKRRSVIQREISEHGCVACAVAIAYRQEPRSVHNGLGPLCPRKR